MFLRQGTPKTGSNSMHQPVFRVLYALRHSIKQHHQEGHGIHEIWEVVSNLPAVSLGVRS